MKSTGKTTESTIRLSLPVPRTVRGYEIRRMPLGVFLQAMTQLQDFPQKAIGAMFPNQGLDEILLSLKNCDSAMIGQLLVRALTVVPQEAMTLLAKLTLIPQQQLLDDEAIGLDGLAEILDSWLEVNQIENFISAARQLLAKAKVMAAASNGSKA